MTAFRDALDLRAAVVEAVGNPDIAEVWPRLVSLAEARLNRELRTRHQVATEAVTLVDGVAALPADYAEALGVYSGTHEAIGGPLTRLATGAYSFAGGIRGPNGPITLEYYAKLPTLSDSLTATNWLLDLYPDVYLYSVAVEAAKHLRDVEAAGVFEALRQQALTETRGDDFTGRYARARIRMKGPTP